MGCEWPTKYQEAEIAQAKGASKYRCPQCGRRLDCHAYWYNFQRVGNARRYKKVDITVWIPEHKPKKGVKPAKYRRRRACRTRIKRKR